MPGKMVIHLAILTPKEIAEIVRRVILETEVAPLVQKEVDKIVKRKASFRTTHRKGTHTPQGEW